MAGGGMRAGDKERGGGKEDGKNKGEGGGGKKKKGERGEGGQEKRRRGEEGGGSGATDHLLSVSRRTERINSAGYGVSTACTR